MADDARVPVPLRTPVQMAMAAARPFKRQMADREVQEKLDEAAESGRWMAAAWRMEGADRIHQFVKTTEFPLSELNLCGWMLVADVMRRMMADDASHVVSRPWGCWWPILECEQAHCDLLYVAKNGYSSIHRHEAKLNVFLPLNGTITVAVYGRKDGEVTKVRSDTINARSKPLLIPPGTPHTFSAENENTLIMELSLPQPGPLSRADIERWTESGLNASSEPADED